MKVAFVYQPANQSMPLGIGYISAVLKREGFDTQFFLLKNINDNTCLEQICRYSPDLVAYSIITGTQKLYLDFNKRIKNKFKKIISVFGGPHPTFFPETIYEDGVDAVCIGEAENAFLHFMKEYKEQRTIPINSPNFWIKYKGEISKSPLLPLVTDLDSLPFPDRDGYFRADPFVKEYARKTFNATRGCPYTCTYCFNESYNKLYSNKNILRQRAPESVCDEIRAVSIKYPLKSVYFVDDVFTINKEWIIDFCDLYAKKINIPFSCNLRLNNVDVDIVKALKEANCHLVYVGTESGSEYIRNQVMKRKMSVEFMLEKVELFHKNKIKILTENIIGNPGETIDMALETLRLNQKINPLFPSASLFTPYPKLPLTEYAIKNNFFDGDYERITNNYFMDTLIKFNRDYHGN